MFENLIGMDKQAAINFLHGRGMTVRIASEDGVANFLTTDYVPNRVDLVIVDGKIEQVISA